MQTLVLAGDVGPLRPSRTFSDGQVFHELTVTDNAGHQQHVPDVFCPNRLLNDFQSSGPKTIYIWKKHVFAVRQGGFLAEDVRGVTRSYLTRDLPALGLMTASIVLAPYALFVMVRKLYGLWSISEMKNALDDA